VRALDGVSLTLEEGESVMLIGPNGAGKTTLVNAVSGYLRVDGGKIIFMNQDLTDTKPTERVRKGIVRSFQLANNFDKLTVYENILVAVMAKKQQHLKFTKVVDNYKEEFEEAEQVLNLFDLGDKAHEYITNISYGDRKLLDAAIAFTLGPKLIMLDEPTSGVATSEKDAVMKKITDAIQRTKVASIIIEHDMDIVFRYGKRVVVLHQGKIIADGTVEQIRRDEEVRRLLLGGIYA
ncbi:MAG: ABC transporter ATP-binding protein, partial [Candidatus Caldarchaeum sp.]|nr:ABC transporter ATP-binding protein [Candidatus Caldarchaeum sp.]